MATTENFTSLYQYVLPELPGVENAKPLLLREIRELITEFCEKTQIWKCQLDAVNIQDGLKDYDFQSPLSYTEISAVTKVERNEVEILPDSAYTMDSPCEIKLVVEPQADETNALVITVALRPTEEASKICGCLYNKWRRTWAYGVMARMMDMPKKAWSNQQQASIYAGRYSEGLSRAKIHTNNRYMNNTLRARPKYVFA